MMKAIALVRPLDIYLHAIVWTHIGMNNFGIKPNLHSWASWRGSQLPELGFF